MLTNNLWNYISSVQVCLSSNGISDGVMWCLFVPIPHNPHMSVQNMLVNYSTNCGKSLKHCWMNYIKPLDTVGGWSEN